MERGASAIRDRVMSVRVRPAFALLSAAIVSIVPVAALYCEVREASSMACCQRDMSRCNEPGKTDDCCNKGSSTRDTTALDLAKTNRLAKPGTTAGHHIAIVISVTTTGEPPAALAPTASHLAAAGAPSPPLRTVLRL